MSKKNINKKKKNSDFLDVSYRGKIDIDANQKYNDEELYALIADLEKQMKQLDELHKEFYSLNARIERVQNRTFIDILRDKIISILHNMIYQENIKEKS